MFHLSIRIPAALLLVVLCGCVTNQNRADQFASPEAQFAKAGAAKTALLYIPNRIMDLLDIVHFGYGIGPGIGLELQLTRPARIGATTAADIGIAWLGRETNPLQAAAYSRAMVGEVEANTYGEDAIVWRIPKWDVGVFGHALLDYVYVGIGVDEICDFFTGLVCYDLKGDDF